MLTLTIPSVTWVFAHPARRSERNHPAVAHELLLGEVQGEALERQASICGAAGEPLPHRLLTLI